MERPDTWFPSRHHSVEAGDCRDYTFDKPKQKVLKMVQITSITVQPISASLLS